jgi:DNA repair protein RadD
MQLRPYQSFAIETTLNHFKYKSEPAILDISVAGGKTIIAKEIVEKFYADGKRVLVIADREELIKQCGEKLTIPFNYYGAAFNASDNTGQITVGSIQSIYDKDFPALDLIICDECQALPNDKTKGMYWEFINKHPQAKLLGLSGTPYRVSGELTWGRIVYSVKYPELLRLGFVAPITNKMPEGTPDLSNVEVTNLGDYSDEELEAVMTDPKLLTSAINAIRKYSSGRNKNLIFCVSIKHCELLKDILSLNAIIAEMVTGKTPKEERRKILDDFKNGTLKHLITCELLLRGYDNTGIDMVTCLRPSKSKGLWEQLLGRMVRLHPNKTNALLVDLSGNLSELGGLGSPHRKKGTREATQAPGKLCPICEDYCLPITTRECSTCGYAFPELPAPLVSHNHNPDTTSKTIYTGEIETYEVRGVAYKEHKSKKTGSVSLRIDYYADGTKYGSISKYLQPHHDKDFVRGKAWQFFKDGGHALSSPIESYSFEDLLWHCNQLKKPSKIVVDYGKPFPEIVRFIYDSVETPKQTMDELLDNDVILF